jgi:hypothetical protein
MKTVLLAGLVLQTAKPTAPNVFQECELETAQLCDPSGCKPGKSTWRIWVADYQKDDGSRGGYYYRCATKDRCQVQILNDFRTRGAGEYRVWSSKDAMSSSHVGPDGSVMDVVAHRERVLISRGKCWDAPPPIIMTPVK